LNLYKSFSTYTFFGFLNRGIPFLLFPILTEYLSPEDYGYLSLFNTCVLIISPFIYFGSLNSVSVEYFKLDKENFRNYISSSLVLPIASFLFFTLAIIVLQDYLKSWLGFSISYLLLIPVISLFIMFFEQLLAILRMQEKPMLFVTINTSKTTIEVLLTLALVVFIDNSWASRINSWLSVSVLFSLISIYYFYHQNFIGSRITKQYVKDEWSFGLPMILFQLNIIVLGYFDRFFLLKYVSLHDIGIYTIGMQLSLITYVISNAFLITFQPYHYSQLKNITELSKLKILRVTYLLAAIMIVFLISFYYISPFLFKYVINQRYAEGNRYVIWISLGYLFWGISTIINNILLYNKSTTYLMIISILNMLIAFFVYYFLISIFKADGAAYAATINYFINLCLVFFFAHKTLPLPWLSFKKIFTLKQG
jgi:O-antigen/teichoic acid export membrane protein